MNLLKGALRKPVTIIVAVIAILFFSFISIKKMRIDTFPQLGLPTVYVAQPYGGLSPEQMEGYITSYYEYHFLYITGVKFVESKSIQGAAIIKIQFQEGTEMSQALAEVVGYVNRAKAFMPPGTVPPFITRFDAGSVPVGELVFTSSTRTLGDISDLALFRVRPLFATLPGVSAPPPFGGNQKTVVVKINPDKVRDYNLSPDDIVQALAKANNISPSGNIRIGDETLITSQNTVVENVKELENVPLRSDAGISIYIRDIGSVSIGSDVTTSYALVNGKRTVYIPVTKRADASTWEVVKKVKAALPDMQAAIPEDIKVTYEFDQSGYVINSLKSLMFEGGLGAILTGLMVLLFLGNKRSALIVVLSIPLSLLTGITVLYLVNQTINIMTLGGLALSVGILVDMATVIIENIHQHLERGKSRTKAILDGCTEVAGPLLLILLSILAVFTPALFMSGVPKGMFMPLSLSVGFSLIASFILSLTFVPVAANWLLRSEKAESKEKKENRFDKFRHQYKETLEKKMKSSKTITWIYLLVSLCLLVLLFSFIGTEIFPKVDAGQAQVRLRMPVGTRIERTEEATQRLLAVADSISGGKIEISSAFIGTQPSSYPINLVYLWTSGPQESVIKINLKKKSGISIESFKEKLRNQITKAIPDAVISFEPGDLVEQVLNLGSSNPVEIAIVGRNFQQTRLIAENLNQQLKAIHFLRDVQISSPLDYPGIKIDIDRIKAGKLGLTIDQISKSIVAATSSSRFTQPNYWLDKNTGTAYQIQVEYPQYRLNSSEELELIPLANTAGNLIYLRDVATLKKIFVPGEYDRINMQRFLTITANIHNKDLGTAVREVKRTISSIGNLPAGVKIMMRGQADLLNQTMSELQSGLLIAIVVIFMMLAVSFQSFKLSVSVLSIIPAVISGSVLLLLLTGKSLNIQSYMGIIMAVGVAVANAILFITNAEFHRKMDPSSGYSSLSAYNRIRPILMTSFAMIAGMIPMSLGLGEGGEQTAPLAIAVIGGLVFSTMSTLLFLPIVYTRFIGNKSYINPSLDPEDENSKYYEKP
jgi:CzcA family heavy metal efflux pump